MNSLSSNKPLTKLDTTTLTDKEIYRYTRQLLLESWDIDAQLNIKKSRVLIIGVGGLGCPVSETLVRAGVGYICIIDDDVIEESNLQRQTLFTSSDIGKSKSQMACEKLRAINDLVMVDYHHQRFQKDTANHSYQSYDLLIDCTDNFATRHHINEISVANKTPLLSASAIAMTGQLALFEPTQGTGCYHCLFGEVNAPEQTCATSGVLASTTAIMGNLQANLALQFLGKNHNSLAGKLLMWNGVTMKQNIMGFRKNEQCTVCGQ